MLSAVVVDFAKWFLWSKSSIAELYYSYYGVIQSHCIHNILRSNLVLLPRRYSKSHHEIVEFFENWKLRRIPWITTVHHNNYYYCKIQFSALHVQEFNHRILTHTDRVLFIDVEISFPHTELVNFSCRVVSLLHIRHSHNQDIINELELVWIWAVAWIWLQF